MKTIKRITSWALVAIMLATTAASPAQAETTTQVTSETTTNASSETTGTTEKSSETTTEATTATEATTEESTEEKKDEVVSEYENTGLSPETAKVIVLDPGHCRKHTGASGNGLREENVVMDIADACQAVLDEYGDVTVYMTRDAKSCVESLGLGDCLAARNHYAKILDADFLVSMHINAGGSTGANVLAAYKSGYNDSIRKETQKFGKLALKNLKAIGVANRGLLLRKSGSGNRYSNGKLADYYSIVRLGVIEKVPSVIIEHGYITSSSDCNKFFKTKAKRKKVGSTDAKSIIEYYGLKKKVVEGTFKKMDGATYYVGKDGKKLAGWVKEDGKWYYFDEMTGKMQSGFVTQGEDTFYLSKSTGEMVTGWFSVDGARYLAKGNGTLVKGQTYSDGRYTYLFNSAGRQHKKGFLTIGNDTYYVGSKKRVVTNCTKKIKGVYYGFDEDGKRVTGYQKLGGKYYYFNPETGAMARKKLVTLEDGTYYFGSNGARSTGWVTYKKNKYYFNKSTGKMVTGWKKISGKYYYFAKTSGKMQKKKWIGKYYVNAKGVRTKKK